MLLTILMLTGSLPFIRKGGRNLPGELGSGMAFSLAFLLGGGYFLAQFHLWHLTIFLPFAIFLFALGDILYRKNFWQKKAAGWKNTLDAAIRNNKLDLPEKTIYFLIIAVAFLFLWFLACEKELPCGWDPSFHAILAGKILKEGALSTSWQPFENIPMNYPQGSHVLIALTAKYGSLCKFLPDGLAAIPEAQKLLMFALVLPSALLIWGIAQETFQSAKTGFFAFVTYLFLGNIGTYSSFWSWGGYPTAVGFLFFTALVYFAVKKIIPEKKEWIAGAVLWGSFGLCHHLSVVIVAVIMAAYTLFCMATKKKEAWDIWKRFFFTGIAACFLYLPGIIFQIRHAGTTANSDVFRFDDDPPYTFLQFLENGSIPLVAGFIALVFLFYYRKKGQNDKLKNDFFLVWALATLSTFIFLEVIFRYCIAIPLYGRNFTLFIPSRFLTMTALPFSVLTGYLLYLIFQNKRIRKIKHLSILFLLSAVLYGCMNFYIRPMGDAPSSPIRLLASSLSALPENAYVIVDPSKIKKAHWLPFLLWKPCITNPIPSSEDRRSVRKGLELFLYTEWEKMDLPAIREYLKERGDQKAYWVIADENGKLLKVFQYPGN